MGLGHSLFALGTTTPWLDAHLGTSGLIPLVSCLRWALPGGLPPVACLVRDMLFRSSG